MICHALSFMQYNHTGSLRLSKLKYFSSHGVLHAPELFFFPFFPMHILGPGLVYATFQLKFPHVFAQTKFPHGIS